MTDPEHRDSGGLDEWRGKYESVAAMARLVEHAQAVCADRGWDPDDAPWVVGYISIERGPKPPPEAFEWARRVVAEYEAEGES